jgi:hypothetical protein
MKKYVLIQVALLVLAVCKLSAQNSPGFQTLKGKKFNYQVTVPKGKYEYSKSSSDKEHWGTYNEPYAAVYAYKDAWFPGGKLGAATMQDHQKKGNMYSGDEMLEYSEVRKEIPKGYKYESRFRIKETNGNIKEYYVIVAVLTEGNYKFDERIWAEARLVFKVDNPEKEQIVSRFFDSFILN